MHLINALNNISKNLHCKHILVFKTAVLLVVKSNVTGWKLNASAAAGMNSPLSASLPHSAQIQSHRQKQLTDWLGCQRKWGKMQVFGLFLAFGEKEIVAPSNTQFMESISSEEEGLEDSQNQQSLALLLFLLISNNINNNKILIIVEYY